MTHDRKTTVAVAVAVAMLVAAGLQFSGGYYALATGILGAIVAVAAVTLLTLGLTPSRPAVAAASMMGALGAWSALSTAWGGLPHASWRLAGLTLAGAAALLVGSALAKRARAVVGGVLAGITVHTIAVLATVGSGSAPTDWFRERQLEGSIGYHNGEATIFAMGLPLALWVASSGRRLERAAGSAVALLLLAAALMTQSRGSLVAIALAIGLQLAIARRARVAALAIVLAAAGVALFLSLRSVDRALVESRPLDDPVFTRHVLLVLLLALIVGALSLPSLPPVRLTRRQTRALTGGAAGLLVVAAVVAASFIAPRLDQLRGPVTPETNPVSAAAGETRLTTFSASGRLELWAVALHMSEEEPVTGSGTGSFTRRWTIDRTNKDATVLQPHSLELEMLAELGVVGLGLLGLAVGAVTWGILLGVRRDRAVGAAVAGSLLAFLLVASVDWVHSFSGLVIPAMLIAGAAAGPGRRRVPSAPRALGYVVALLVTLGVLAGPALAQYQLDRARSRAETSAAEAWEIAAAARSWDRWDPAVVEFQALLAERDGRFRDAAALYRRAATLSVRPWPLSYREAGALQQAGLSEETRAACQRAIAANPLDPDLQSGVCQGAT